MCLSTNLHAQGNYQHPKRVLALFSFKPGLPFSFHIEQSLRSTLSSDHSFAFILDVEHADQSRFPDENYKSKIVDLYRYKYGKQNIDLVIAVGDEASALLLENGTQLFGDIPTIFVTTKSKQISPGSLKSNAINITWGVDIRKTGEIIKKLLPDTKNLYVVSDSSMIGQSLKRTATLSLAELKPEFSIHHLDDITVQELFVKVSQLAEHSAILFLSFFKDASGQSFVPLDVVTKLSEHANAPVFGFAGPYLGHGIVGGNLLSPSYQGKKYAEIIKKILTGIPLKNLKNSGSENQMIFDWRQLKRWSINEDKLPAESIVRYREFSIWEEHSWEVAITMIIISFLILMLIALIIQNNKRRKAEDESQKLKDERAHTSRVLSMGEIAASLAHELNQPLSAIRTYAQSAQRFLDNTPAETDEVSKALNGIIAGNRRAEDVIKRIRMAMKKEPFEQSCLDVRELIDDVIILIGKKAEENNISIRIEMAEHLAKIYVDRIQLQQVLFNLMRNALEAMQNITEHAREIVLQVSMKNSKMLMIAVQDSGIGIDVKQRDVLFDAFYTTKDEGMGMGLSISRSIIEDHGGQLWAAMNKDTGSTFSFTIPIYDR